MADTTSKVTNTETTPPVEDTVYIASQWQLMWWRFRKHKLALIGGAVIIFFFIIALFPEFFATGDPQFHQATFAYSRPQALHWFRDGGIHPFVYPWKGQRDPVTLGMVYTVDTSRVLPVHFFVRGQPYKLLGLFPADIHLIGLADANSRDRLTLLGTDRMGRDMWSRLMYGTRISMSIGLVGVALSLTLGILLGGISGFYAGTIDIIIQRSIEFIRSIPHIPLWMGLAAAMPRDWPPLRVYFGMTVILSLLGWTGMARVVRGRFLSLREEDFVMAARLSGSSEMRIIVRHMVPSFLSHIIASVTLAIPGMILSETSLSFLGLGLRPPVISWGVLLQEAQNIRTVATAPWLLYPGIAVIISVLAYNFLGDGLRDAADPYSR